MKQPTFIAASIIALATLSSTALASPGPGFVNIREGLYSPFGLNLGFSGIGRYGGLLLGAEGSLVWYDSTWFGIYGDVLRDFGAGSTRASFGPEIGVEVFGLDGGVVFDSNAEDKARVGGRFRGLLTLSAVTAYGGATIFREEAAVEIGLLFKFPWMLADKPRGWD